MGNSQAEESDPTASKMLNFLKDHDLEDTVSIFHIESKDFDANIFLDTFYKDKTISDFEEALQTLKYQMSSKSNKEKILIEANSPIIIDCFCKTNSLS